MNVIGAHVLWNKLDTRGQLWSQLPPSVSVHSWHQAAHRARMAGALLSYLASPGLVFLFI